MKLIEDYLNAERDEDYIEYTDDAYSRGLETSADCQAETDVLHASIHWPPELKEAFTHLLCVEFRGICLV